MNSDPPRRASAARPDGPADRLARVARDLDASTPRPDSEIERLIPEEIS